jgi:type VI secretion system secreted protein VgrG
MKTKLMTVTFSLRMGLIVAAAIFLSHSATAQITPVSYGSASSFSILSGAGITFAATGPSTISGNIGAYPTLSITGVPANVVFTTGASQNQGGDALTQDATAALSTAYPIAAGETVTTVLTGSDNQLGGQTLVPGVYQLPAAATANLIGTLTLDPNGVANPVWIFEATSTLITASNSSVVLDPGAVPCDVLWVVGSSATLGTGTNLVGTIMASASITLNTNVTLDGRAWAVTGAVTLDEDTVTGLPCTSIGDPKIATVPDNGGTLLLLGAGLAALLGFGRRFIALL